MILLALSFITNLGLIVEGQSQVVVKDYSKISSYSIPPNRICGEVQTEIRFNVEHTEEAFQEVYEEKKETLKTKNVNEKLTVVDQDIDNYLYDKKANRNIQSRDSFVHNTQSRDQTDAQATSVSASGSGMGFSASASAEHSFDRSVKTASSNINKLATFADSAKENEGTTHVKKGNYGKTQTSESLEYEVTSQKKDEREFNGNFLQIYRITKLDATIRHTSSGRLLGVFSNTEKIYKDSSHINNHESNLALRERSLLYARDHYGINATNFIAKISVINHCVNGRVIYYYPNGDMYRGEFKHGKRHGWGEQKSRNGDSYEGYWIYDRIDESRIDPKSSMAFGKTIYKFSDLVTRTDNLDRKLVTRIDNLDRKLVTKTDNLVKAFFSFENLEGWTKIESDVSNNLYYMLMDFHGVVDFLGAQVLCKEFRADANLAEVHSLKEMEGLRKLAAGRNKHYWMNAYNGKASANKLIDYVWLNSGKIVSPNLWYPGEGTIGGERTLAFHSSRKAFFDIPHTNKYYAACELRS